MKRKESDRANLNLISNEVLLHYTASTIFVVFLIERGQIAFIE